MDSPNEGGPQPILVMRRLWLRMAEVYGHRWTSAYGEDAGKGAGLTWAKGLKGLQWGQIAAGLEEAILTCTDGWPPTMPEFRALCLGIPSLAAARADVVFSRPTRFGRLMWQYLDAHRMRQASSDAFDRMVRDAYTLAREHVMCGGAMPELAEELLPAPAAPEFRPANEARVAKHIQQIGALLGLSASEIEAGADILGGTSE